QQVMVLLIAGERGARRGVELEHRDRLKIQAIAAPRAPVLRQLTVGDRKQEAAEARVAAEPLAGLDAAEEGLLDQIFVGRVGRELVAKEPSDGLEVALEQ